MEQDIINDYTRRASFAKEEADKFKKLSNEYSLYRLVVFGLFIISVYIAAEADNIYIAVFSLIVLITWFSWLVKKQSHFETLTNYFLDIKKVNENEIGSIQSQANMYDNGAGLLMTSTTMPPTWIFLAMAPCSNWLTAQQPGRA